MANKLLNKFKFKHDPIRIIKLQEESTTQQVAYKTKSMIVPGHRRTLNTGAIINVDPYMAVKNIKHRKGTVKVVSDIRHTPAQKKHMTKKVGDILSVITDPNVNKKVKRNILKNIEVHTSPNVSHATVKVKGGKLLLVVNSKYFSKK